MSADLSEVRKRLAAKRASSVGEIPAADAVDPQVAPPPDDQSDVVTHTVRPTHKENRDKRKQAEKLAASTSGSSVASSPTGTSPKTDTPQGGPVTRQPVQPPSSQPSADPPNGAPGTPDPPAQPAQTSPPSPEFTLSDRAVIFAHQGFATIKDRQPLHAFVVDKLGEVFQIPTQYSISEINTAASAAVDPLTVSTVVSTSESRKDRMRRRLNLRHNIPIRLVLMFAAAGSVLFVLGFLLVQWALPHLGLQSMWFLIGIAVVLAVWAIVARFRNPEYNLKRLRVWFVGLMILAGSIFGSSSGSAVANGPNAHPVEASKVVADICHKYDKSGKFDTDGSLEGCAGSLRIVANQNGANPKVKVMYENFLYKVYTEGCAAEFQDFASDKGKQDQSGCLSTAVMRAYGKQVSDLIATGKA